MTTYVLRRLLQMVPVLFGVAILVFLILRVIPGDPAQLMLGNDATPESVAALDHQLGLDKPLPIQFVDWIGNAARGDLGTSYFTKRPVVSDSLQAFESTALLVVVALAFASVFGIVFGVLAALYRNSWVDKVSMIAATGGISVPDFAAGIILIVLFAVQLRLLPPGGMYSPRAGPSWGDLLAHLLLPAVTLSLHSMALIARVTRSAMLQVLGEAYVRTAHAKGLARQRVVRVHALKNAMLPVITVIGIQVGRLFGAAVVVETVFAWPGVGSLLLQSIETRDYPIIQGVLLIGAAIIVAMNFTVDLLYGAFDPRVKVGASHGGSKA